MLTYVNKVLFIGFILFLINGCDFFEFSPFEINLDNNESGLTNKNIKKILNTNISYSDNFEFAVISDTHSSYEELKDAIQEINNNDDILFVIHTGDLTDFGLKQEYQWCNDLLDELTVPYITVIGNHDCLSNGVAIYKKMYGKLNYSFIFNDVKFIFFNDNIWEFDKNVPDFNWLEKELSNNSLLKHVFVIAHIPPFDRQFNENDEKKYKNIMKQNNISMSIHGHDHKFYYDKYYNDNISYLCINNIKSREYCIVKIDEDSLKINRIFF